MVLGGGQGAKIGSLERLCLVSHPPPYFDGSKIDKTVSLPTIDGEFCAKSALTQLEWFML